MAAMAEDIMCRLILTKRCKNCSDVMYSEKRMERTFEILTADFNLQLFCDMKE